MRSMPTSAPESKSIARLFLPQFRSRFPNRRSCSFDPTAFLLPPETDVHRRNIVLKIFLRPPGVTRMLRPVVRIAIMPKEKPKVNIGEVIRSYRSDRGLSQGDIERRTGLLRCYLSRVENGHTVPSLETLAKIAEAMEIALADFFPGSETPRDRDTQKMLGELSDDEIRFLSEIKKYSTTLSEGDKRLVLAMIRKMATVMPLPTRKPVARRSAY